MPNNFYSYNLNKSTASLAECNAQTVKLQQQINELELCIDDQGNEISDLKRLVYNGQTEERNIIDNLRFRENQRKLTELEASIAILRHEQVQHDSASYPYQIQKLTVKQTKLNSEVKLPSHSLSM